MDESITVGACCDNLTVTDAIPEWYWIATDGSDDTGDGHYTRPWKTLAYACTQVTTPGDVIHLKAGTYNETTQIVKPLGISIRGQGDNTHIISTFTHASNLQGSIQCVSPDGITTDDNSSISYIKLTGSNLTAGRGIFVGYRNNVEIHHCTIEDFAYYGIYFYASSTAYPDLFMTGHSVHDCIITNCSNNATGYPGNVRTHGTDGLLIYNNVFDNRERAAGSNGNSIKTLRDKRLKIYNNTFYRNDSEIAADGTYGWNFFIENWDYRGDCEYYNNTHYGLAKVDIGGELNNVDADCTYGFKVYNNVFLNPANAPRSVNGNEEDYVCITVEGDGHDRVEVYNNYMQRYNWGIALTTPSSGTGYWHHNWNWDDIKIHHNIIENIGYSDFQYSGIGIWWANGTNDAPYYGTFANVLIANNTITGNNGGTYPGYNGIRMDANGTATNITISNNIITGFSQNAISINAHSNDSLDLINCDVTYNCFYNNGTNAVFVEAAINETNLDVATGNITADPQFVSTSTFELSSSSPCINAGTYVGLTRDFYNRRLVGVPDIGAIEYGAIGGERFGKNRQGVMLKSRDGRMMIYN
jgi:hypothetical protein